MMSSAQVAARNNVKIRYVDMSGPAGPANLASVITDNTKLIMIESPTNPMQRIINIPDICRVAHSKNALVEVQYRTVYYGAVRAIGTIMISFHDFILFYSI